MKDPSRAVWLAASLRMEIDRLNEATERADELQAPDIASKLRDLVLELAKLYQQLIKLAAPAPPGSQRKNASHKDDVPF